MSFVVRVIVGEEILVYTGPRVGRLLEQAAIIVEDRDADTIIEVVIATEIDA